MTARPPAASIASTISLSPQATTTGPISAASARRQTWDDHRDPGDIGEWFAGQPG